MGREAIGTFEAWVLMALVRLRDRAYGRTIHDELQARLGRQIPIGQVYVTLERMETKGFVKSELGGATPTRGGRVKRFFTLTASGDSALREALRAIDALRADGFAGARS